MLFTAFFSIVLNKILPPINNIYFTSINIPLIGMQNIKYERTKIYIRT